MAKALLLFCFNNLAKKESIIKIMLAIFTSKATRKEYFAYLKIIF